VPRDGGGRRGDDGAAVVRARGRTVGHRQAAGPPRRDGGRGRAPPRGASRRILLRRRPRRTRRLFRRPVPQARTNNQSPDFLIIFLPPTSVPSSLLSCLALQGRAVREVLSTKNLEAITASIQRAFAAVDAKLCTWLVSVLELRFSVDCFACTSFLHVMSLPLPGLSKWTRTTTLALLPRPCF
jgi:hypothetical protein